MCLLNNDGTLPLDEARIGRVAVIGPNACHRAAGRLFQRAAADDHADRRAAAGRAGKAEFVTAQGVFITHSEDRSPKPDRAGRPRREPRLIAEAVELARGADAIMLAIGDTEQTSREGFAVNHLGDRTTLDLVGEQNELFDALHALGKPLMVAAINGRPPSWPNIAEHADAVLECWYPGQEGGAGDGRDAAGA